MHKKECDTCYYSNSTPNDHPCSDCTGFERYTTFPMNLKDINESIAKLPTKNGEYFFLDDLPEPPHVVPESTVRSQVGGNHYAGPAGFPEVAEFAQVHGMKFSEASILKYVFRHSRKGGVKDLLKALDYLLILGKTEYKEDLMKLYQDR